MVKGITFNHEMGVNGSIGMRKNANQQQNRKASENVSPSRTINASQTLLDMYRDGGVDLELSGTEQTDEDMEEKENTRKVLEERSLAESYQEQLEAAKKNAEAAGEGFQDMGRALEIARRLMHGDHVPGSDEKFLMDYNRDLYMSAKNMQALAKNDDPKDYKSILEEEENEDCAIETDGNGNITIDASKLIDR